ncbi:MAG: hypothetical protein AB8B67_04090 [Rickettsiaceae bacterium]
MLFKNLQSQLNANRLYNSSIIESNDLESSLYEIEKFIIQCLFKQKNLQLESCQDYCFISLEKDAKDISIDQIRSLYRFFSTTNSFFDCKIGVIYQAHLMNKYAANACLKILEDTKPYHFIFLITNDASKILPTICSRCMHFINKKELISSDIRSYADAINKILSSTYLDRNAIDFLTSFDTNQSNLCWLSFANYLLKLLSYTMKYKSNIDLPNDINEQEIQIIQIIQKRYNINSLIDKFDEISKIINDTSKFNLDGVSSLILIINLLK